MPSPTGDLDCTIEESIQGSLGLEPNQYTSMFSLSAEAREDIRKHFKNVINALDLWWAILPRSITSLQLQNCQVRWAAMNAVTVLNIIPQEANPIRGYVLTTMKGDVEKSMRLLTTHLMMGCKSH